VARPLAERRRELAERHGFACACDRCILEEGVHLPSPEREKRREELVEGSLSVPSLLTLSDQAQEESRYEDAERVARMASRLDPGNGDALHKAGVALLGQGRWAEAHAAWRAGYALAPDHPALAAQAAKDAAYDHPGLVESSPRPASASARAPDELVTVHAAGVWRTRTAMLSRAECAEWIALAEAAASKRGGWTTARHYAVPTTDLPVHAVPELLPRWNAFRSAKLAPFLAAAAPDLVRNGGANVRVHDAFVVRYDASAQHHLPMHRDQSSLSVTLALNDPGDDFEGGGTAFAAPVGETVSPEAGHVVAFRGGLRHGGAPVVRGTRYVVAAFLFTE
jgi:predicted 2-oxoglutarate/Fe(II)-dependent dioxygenase YbiX